ncbi:hypothetical protein [Posidoniimonas corsicana]|uniref:hypothetical protein n=1 Tax=Posidoniimonas corsicana TaxID=1938618 RepID=UPI0011B35B11|nr:hypothetical protein [Posidoniimonas corsicana]
MIHIDTLAEHLRVERRWIINHWLKYDGPAGPCPHWRDGQNTFFHVGDLDEWTHRRCLPENR